MTKQVLSLIALSLVASAARADFRALANTDFCEGVDCTAPMKQIDTAFNGSIHFAVQGDPNVTYAGSCYLIHPNKDANQERYALAVFRPGENGAIESTISYDQFAKRNPYVGLTGEKALTVARKNHGTTEAVTLETTKGRIDSKLDVEKWTTYLRTNESGSELYLLSKWQFPGGEQRTFCRLNRQ